VPFWGVCQLWLLSPFLVLSNSPGKGPLALNFRCLQEPGLLVPLWKHEVVDLILSLDQRGWVGV
jgi:hypothetical protein